MGTEELINRIKYDSESSTLDFKKEQYPLGNHPKKHEMLKDFSAFVNHLSETDKFIICGVKERNGRAINFFNIDHLEDEAKYQQYINDNIEPKINFEYKSFEYNGFNLSYFRLFNNHNRPYLLKKDIQNPTDKNKTELKKGDGFIRIGTSNKKLIREDFDAIYDAKNRVPDRKSEIIIHTLFGNPDNEFLKNHDCKYIDISIENLSNKSIRLDAEMKVFFGDNYQIFEENELIKELTKNENPSLRLLPPFSSLITYNPHISVENFEDHINISRTKLRNEETALIISPKDIEKETFSQSLIIVGDYPISIIAEVLLRSDDFVDGILIKQVEFIVEP